MAAKPRMRRWTDVRDGREWSILFEPGVEEDRPTVRYFREGLVFEGEGGPFHAPAVYGSDLEDLTDGDIQGLLDQARSRRKQEHRVAGWGLRTLPPEEAGAATGEGGAATEED